MASELPKDVISHVTTESETTDESKDEHVNFHKCFLQFLDDLEGTFPEFKDDIKVLRDMDGKTAQAKFVKLWRDRTGLLLMQDVEGAIFDDEILPNIEISKKLWNELSEKTQTAIFNHLNTLVILSANMMSDSMFDIKGIAEHMKTMEESPMMKDLFEKVSSAFATFDKSFKKETKPAGGAGTSEEEPKLPFKIPEKLFKGHIAKMAEELAKEFKPEDFGLSPELLETSDPTKVFAYLQEVFTKNPDLLMKGAQKIAKKIQGKFERGEIKREELLAEAEEMMKEFGENEVFKGLFGSLGEMMKMSEPSGSVSERRRAVQERLRKKLESRKAKK
jgi:hypothetical protein